MTLAYNGRKHFDQSVFRESFFSVHILFLNCVADLFCYVWYSETIPVTFTTNQLEKVQQKYIFFFVWLPLVSCDIKTSGHFIPCFLHVLGTYPIDGCQGLRSCRHVGTFQHPRNILQLSLSARSSSDLVKLGKQSCKNSFNSDIALKPA